MNEFNVVGLYDHNADSYRKVREAFETNDVVGIVHATGTGKSYNALQLAYDNKDKKIIYVVPSVSIVEHIKKIIDDNPNLDIERDFPNLEFRTYQSFINMNTDEIAELDIDLLILDEFHHIGAPVWGSRIDTVIDTHPSMKIFGMTAYTVRDRGTSYERDMALDEGDELFSDNIVSEYDLCDAMIDGVLPKPIYRSSYIKLYDMASELEQRVQRLASSGRDCSEYVKILSDVKKRLHEAPSMGDVVKKNIKKNGKYIYFCPPFSEEGTNDIETIKKEAMSWFEEIAPEEDIVIYTSLSEMKDGGKSQREAFYDDLDLDGNKVDGKLRVMFAINQYNEGVHAPNIDGVIMGRGTCSDIVFFEQLGRALSVSSGVKEKIELYSTYSIERLRLMCSQNNINFNYDMSRSDLIEKLVAPVIIDLAGNIDFIRELEDNLKDRLKDLKEKGNGTLIRGVLSDASFDLDMYEVNLFNILMDLKEKTEMTWDDWYKLAEEYYKEHDDLNVPKRYVTSGGARLGNWVSNQRKAYKNRDSSIQRGSGVFKPLSDEQVSMLERIGMVWDAYDSQWNKMFELAQQYFLGHGNLLVSASYITDGGANLGSWISHQRKAYKNRFLSKSERNTGNKPLTDEQVFMLERIGMIWNPVDSQWNKMYELAQQYFLDHGNLEIPNNYVADNGEKLGQWIGTQRVAYKKRNISSKSGKLLTDEKVIKLESIGMVWDMLDSTWNKMYELAQLYFLNHGNLDIPNNYVTDNGEKLGKWINSQRVAYKNRTLSKDEIKSGQVVLSDDRLKKLEEIGMVWGVLDLRWDKMYELARRYFLEYGNLDVPMSYVALNGTRLGIWVGKNRQNYKKGRLSAGRISKLESIGMIWDVSDLKWNEMYILAEEYYKEHDDLNVPKRYVTSDGARLGQWINLQRQAYKNKFLPIEQRKGHMKPLTYEQVQKLESIGMLWDTKTNKPDIENICIINKIDIEKNKSVIDYISLTEFKVKMKFLEENGYSIVDENGLLHEIFSMSSMNMKLKYDVSLEDLVNLYGKEKSK